MKHKTAEELREQWEKETGFKFQLLNHNGPHPYHYYVGWLEQRLLLSSEAEKGENLPSLCQSTMKESHGVCLMPSNSCQQCKWTDTPSPPFPQEKQGVEEGPGEITVDGINEDTEGYKRGWNECLTECKKLNQ